MKAYNLSGSLKREVLNYGEEIHLAVIRAFLIDNKSHRKIQREILNLPAPAHGGGFVTMNILHYYGISGEDKGLLRRKSLQEVLLKARGTSREVLLKLKDYQDYENEVQKQIAKEDFEFHDRKTEISRTTKTRINQSVLRRIVLQNYRNECALCKIKSADLLVCSHIVPWGVDKKNRLNPKNAMCLCVLHDKLFENGYFCFDNALNITLSKKADKYIKSLIKGYKFKKPEKAIPHFHFIEFHRSKIFKK